MGDPVSFTQVTMVVPAGIYGVANNLLQSLGCGPDTFVLPVQTTRDGYASHFVASAWVPPSVIARLRTRAAEAQIRLVETAKGDTPLPLDTVLKQTHAAAQLVAWKPSDGRPEIFLDVGAEPDPKPK